MTSAEQEARLRLEAGRPDQACGILRAQLGLTPTDAQLRTMLAQLLASLGRKHEAIAELAVAVEQAPRARVARLLLARLANELAQPALAEHHAKTLIASDARDSEAWSALGSAAFGLGRRNAARDAFREAVSLAPEYAAARYNLASVLCDQERSEEALAEAEAAIRLGVRSRGVTVVRARALIQLDRLEEAEVLLCELLAASPGDAESHGILVRMRQLRGDADPLRDLRAAARPASAPAEVRLAFADALRRSRDGPSAEEELRRLVAELGRVPQLLTSLAAVLQENGQTGDAFAHAREAHELAPEDAGVAENFVVSAIASGNAADALPVVEHFRAAQPADQRWVAYRIDIARLRRETEFDAWFDPRIVMRTYDLPAPDATLVSELGALHRQKSHPLDQSLRGGTQTSRNLLIQPPPLVAQLLESFGSAVAEYQREIGNSEGHPLLSRNTSPAALIGCWSVRLGRAGFHVNHIHPEGWLSSAYYVSVPREVEDRIARPGWLKFGEPRFPVDGLAPFEFVQPLPGRLVLFPSYLWHGTHPLMGDESRMSVAFDAVPRAEIQ